MDSPDLSPKVVITKWHPLNVTPRGTRQTLYTHNDTFLAYSVYADPSCKDDKSE